MHLGNGAVTPECAVFAATVAAAGLGLAAFSARREAIARPWLTAGVLGSAVFAAQMINLPVLPFSSGHLVGGVLLAIALGPGRGALTMAIVLALQAFLLGDGGVLALGVNIINMALLPAAVVMAYHHWQPATSSTGRRVATIGALAAVATMLAAGAIVLQVAAFRGAEELGALPAFATSMLLIHAWIAVGEGVATAGLVWALGLEPVSPSLPVNEVCLPTRRLALLAVAALMLLAVSPFASGLPDGYEASAQASGWTSLLAE